MFGWNINISARTGGVSTDLADCFVSCENIVWILCNLENVWEVAFPPEVWFPYMH